MYPAHDIVVRKKSRVAGNPLVLRSYLKKASERDRFSASGRVWLELESEGGVARRLRAALEAQFWLPGDADQVRMLNAFADGRRRIIAVAERKIRLHPGVPVRLTADHFEIRR
ncbi:hypothetical protein [Paraburkholderia sp. CI3]|uniref:hypothetical protein n=1 Tax=Paraburkholderia sp. CI3 TaxID=2991060 RepID=UPI003D22FAA4